MKRLFMCFAGAMMVLALAACSPKKSDEEVVAGPEPGMEVEMGMPEQTTAEPKQSLVTDPNLPVMDSAIVYMIREGRNGLNQKMCEVEELNEQTVVDLLIEYEVLEEGTEVKSFEIEGGEKAGPGVDPAKVGSGERIGTLNLSKMPADTDKAVLVAIANSFCDNFELDKLVLQVEGAAYEHEVITDGYLYEDDTYGKLD